MRFLIQVCKSANLKIDEYKVDVSIKKGLVVFVSFTKDDTFEIGQKMNDKLLNLRIFKDKNDKTNLSIKDVCGDMLYIPQFTLYANCQKGNRPSFVDALDPNLSHDLFTKCCKDIGLRYQNGANNVYFGIFQSQMDVALINDGPFTIFLDSKEIFK